MVLAPMLVPFWTVCSALVSWQEAKTLVKETLAAQLNTVTISLVPPRGVTDAQSETDQVYMPMSHITAVGSILSNVVYILISYLEIQINIICAFLLIHDHFTLS